MYVNNRTLDFGNSGKEALKKFLSEAASVGAIPEVNEIEFV
jgi:predicted solute-binding protein